MVATPLVGTAYPVLADIMGRVTWFPFLFALMSDQWVWAVMVMLVYHYNIYLPLRQITNPALPAAQTFPSLETDPTARQLYMIMALVGIGAAIAGAVVRRLLHVPFFYMPIAHLVREAWPLKAAVLTDATQSLIKHKTDSLAVPPISKRYTIYATIAFVIAVGGSLASQEIYAWVHGGGDRTLDWVMAFIPTAAMLLALLPSFFFDANETYAIFGFGAGVRTRSIIAAAKMVLCTLLASAIPQIVALYIRNANVVIMTGGLVIVGIVGISFVLDRTLFADTPEMYKVRPQQHVSQIYVPHGNTEQGSRLV